MANGISLENARQLADVTVDDLWLRYFALGGTATPDDMGSFLRGEHDFGTGQHDVLVHALNERFVELELNHPVPYTRNP